MDESLNALMATSLFRCVSRDVLVKFIRTYLLESYQLNVRWTMHSIMFNIYRNLSLPSLQDTFYDILTQMWPDAMYSYGSKAAQYVDLLGYVILKSPEHRVRELLQRLVDLYKYETGQLATHANSAVYSTLQSLLGDQFDGYYLESEPCFICNNIETPVANIKLNTIKADSRFTTNQQIFKLVGTHAISKILIKCTDIRKTKMVSLLNVYYTNKQMQSIVDLKMNPKLWLKAKRVLVQPLQSEIKIEFQLPIVACNLIVEYADFYDRDLHTTNQETTLLQCPRCSASVPAHPGVCTQCGENVFQCHKCRAINYDERDPFLCNSCGFCKFAKFDFTLVARAFTSIDPIECEEDRKHTLQTINSLLDRADKIYFNLSQQIKPALEALVIKLNEQNSIERYLVSAPPAPAPAPAQPAPAESIRLTPLTVVNNNGTSQITINASNTAQTAANQAAATTKPAAPNAKTVQSIQQKYSMECKSKFDELAKIIIKLNLCKKELREYDKQFRTDAAPTSSRKNSVQYQTASSIQNALG